MNEDFSLWMGNIDPTMDESIIRNLLKFYNVYPLNIKLIKDSKTNENKNYCFIYFKNVFETNRALNKLKGKQMPNSSFKFKINWANYITSETKIAFVGNLNPSIDDTSLLNFFKSKYKSVLKAKIITENGKSKKYGFVTFKKGKDYRKSIIEMNGTFFEGTNIRVKEYKRKDEDDDENDKNKQENLISINTNYQIELKNPINNNFRLLNMNKLNSSNSNFLSISNSSNKLNWINDANPINDVIIGINNNNYTFVNNKNNWLNQNIYNNGYVKNNNTINLSNSIKEMCYFEMLNNNDINKINNDNKNNNIINNNNNNQTNKNKIDKISKLEILEEFDEKALIVKINESLNKILEYYKKNMLIDGNHVVSKLFLFLMFL